MTMTSRVLLLAIAALLSTPLESQDASHKPSGQTPAAGKQAATTAAPRPHDNEGQRVFEQNCSRCHTAPTGFPPSISGTIVRHMRVRAGLSQHDEEELMRFLNP
jgi:cytochrome c5